MTRSLPRRDLLRTALLAAAAFAGAPRAAAAQGIGLDGAQGGSGPVEITARNGIEWDRIGRRYIARGEARVARGDTSVQAERLIAHYRERNGTDGGTQIYRYEAVGNVRVATPTQTVTADQAVYDVEGGVIVLTGRSLRLTTPNEVLTARDALEYWDQRHMAVARGDATIVTRDDRRMRADVLSVYMLAPGEQLAPRPRARANRSARPGGAAAGPLAGPAALSMPLMSEGDNNRVKRVEAFGNVVIATATDVARGDRGVYSAETGIATISGNVKLTSGQNQLDGDVAEVNMDTGVSRLLPRSGGDGRVRALFVPGDTPAGPGGARGPAPPPGQRR